MPGRLFASLRGYRRLAARDLVAGVMLATIALPGQLATARLAGMPPPAGIYAFVAGSLAFAAFGANRFMSVAAGSTIVPIFAGGLAGIAGAGAAGYAGLAALLAVMVGVLLLAIGLLRAGWLATLLSIPVTTGFLAGISVHIIAGQLPSLLGITDEAGPLLLRLVHILGRVGASNRLALALGAGVLIVTRSSPQCSARGFRAPSSASSGPGSPSPSSTSRLGRGGGAQARPSRRRSRPMSLGQVNASRLATATRKRGSRPA